MSCEVACQTGRPLEGTEFGWHASVLGKLLPGFEEDVMVMMLEHLHLVAKKCTSECVQRLKILHGDMVHMRSEPGIYGAEHDGQVFSRDSPLHVASPRRQPSDPQSVWRRDPLRSSRLGSSSMDPLFLPQRGEVQALEVLTSELQQPQSGSTTSRSHESKTTRTSATSHISHFSRDSASSGKRIRGSRDSTPHGKRSRDISAHGHNAPERSRSQGNQGSRGHTEILRTELQRGRQFGDWSTRGMSTNRHRSAPNLFEHQNHFEIRALKSSAPSESRRQTIHSSTASSSAAVDLLQLKPPPPGGYAFPVGVDEGVDDYPDTDSSVSRSSVEDGSELRTLSEEDGEENHVGERWRTPVDPRELRQRRNNCHQRLEQMFIRQESDSSERRDGHVSGNAVDSDPDPDNVISIGEPVITGNATSAAEFHGEVGSESEHVAQNHQIDHHQPLTVESFLEHISDNK